MEVELYKAVEADRPDTLKSLLDRGADVNEFYQDYTLISAKSILHMCCEKGRIECVKVLLDKGADPRIKDTWYQTPLMYCILTHYHDIVELLLSRDPDGVDVGDKYGKSALHIAVENGCLECIKMLLKHNGFVDVITIFGITPLMTACGSKDLPPEDVVAMVTLLLDAGADCQMKCYRSRRTALQMAIPLMNVSVIEKLVAADSDPNTLDSGGRCPITNLLWHHRGLDVNGDLDDDVMTIVIMLVQSGADLNISKFEHSNVLTMATLYRCTNLVAYLLDAGADQNTEFYCGVTPLQIATKNQDIKTMKVLLQYKSDMYGQGRVVRGSLDYFTDVFHLAMDIGAFEVAILLMEVGYDLTRVSYLVDWSKSAPEVLRNNPTMLDFFRQNAVSVKRLYQLSVFSIRETLSGNIAASASKLPLPKLLIQAIDMTNELT